MSSSELGFDSVVLSLTIVVLSSAELITVDSVSLLLLLFPVQAFFSTFPPFSFVGGSFLNVTSLFHLSDFHHRFLLNAVFL